MAAVVLIILAEEYDGVHAAPHFGIVLALDMPWLLLPLLTLIRMAREHPFTEPVPAPIALPQRWPVPAKPSNPDS
jgi:hypothetical protein